jgi:GTP-dependent phosphoenolpyruvate carboxykinase
MYIEILDKASAIAAYINGNIDGKELKFIDLADDSVYTVEGYGLTAVASKDVFALRATEVQPEKKKGWFHLK